MGSRPFSPGCCSALASPLIWCTMRPDGRMAGPDGISIEDFDMADNLMLDGGVLRREGRLVQREVPEADRLTDLQAFKECLAIAAKQHLA